MSTEDLQRLRNYKKKFASLDVELLPGEELKHCIDSRYYFPEWAISNMGRGYSLHQKERCST